MRFLQVLNDIKLLENYQKDSGMNMRVKVIHTCIHFPGFKGDL